MEREVRGVAAAVADEKAKTVANERGVLHRWSVSQRLIAVETMPRSLQILVYLTLGQLGVSGAALALSGLPQPFLTIHRLPRVVLGVQLLCGAETPAFAPGEEAPLSSRFNGLRAHSIWATM